MPLPAKTACKERKLNKLIVLGLYAMFKNNKKKQCAYLYYTRATFDTLLSPKFFQLVVNKDCEQMQLCISRKIPCCLIFHY